MGLTAPSGWRRVGLDVWPLALAAVLCGPLLVQGGYPLARDLIFVPHEPLTDSSIGLGGSAPRAVPLDAAVGVLEHVVDGAVLARIVLPLILAAAGWGAHRLLDSTGFAGRLTAAGFAVWNPFVVERLALGQWALLAAYAAVPWLALFARRWRHGERGALWPLSAWLGVASLTATGGLLGTLMVLSCGARRRASSWWLAGVCLVVQLPWLVPSVLGAAGAKSDPSGVDAFSADPDGPGGLVISLLGLGGVWDAHSVPATRESWWTPLSACVVVLVLAVAWRRLDAATGGLRSRLAVVGGLGFALALLPHLPAGDLALRHAMDAVPGAGLLRDGQKFLAPFALVVCLALGVAVDRAVRVVARRLPAAAVGAAILAVLTPIVLLPDATSQPWRTLDPVHYPEAFNQIEDALDGQPGDVATLPWRGYRSFGWAHHDLTSSDPAVRWFDRTVLVSDDLQVGSTLVRGESARAHDVGAALASEPVAVALRQQHVSWAVVYPDDPQAGQLSFAGLEPVVVGGEVELYRVPGASPPPPVASWRRVLVAGTDLAVALALVVAAAVAVTGGMTRSGARRRRRDARAGGGTVRML